MVISKLNEINESIMIGFINISNFNKKIKSSLSIYVTLNPEKELI